MIHEIRKNHRKLEDAERNISRALRDYAGHVIVSGPVNRFDCITDTTPTTTCEGRIASIDLGQAVISLETDDGAVQVRYADIIQDPRYTCPVVNNVTFFDIPSRIVTPENPDFNPFQLDIV